MRLPSLNALRAFEAAARLESFARAAGELHVTEGAVSRHVKLLEDELGLPLFFRRPRKVELTEHGRKLLPVLTKAFKTIATGVAQVAVEGKIMKLVSQPSYSIRWLIPRLDDFRRRHPEIPLHVTTALGDWEDIIGGGFDLAFGCGPRCPEGWEAQKIVPAAMTPVCAPRLLAGRTLHDASDLAGFNLLHTTPDRRDWRIWLAHFGAPGIDVMMGETFPTLDMAMQAAVMGQGIAMGELTLLGDELGSGKLVCPLPDLVYRSDDEDYYVWGPAEIWDKPRIKIFRDWLAEVASPKGRSITMKEVAPALAASMSPTVE